jgi:hypothetical protein
MSKSWNFSVNEENKATEYFQKNGFVGFYDLLSKRELEKIRSAISEAVEKRKLAYGENELLPNQDIIFAHPVLEEYVKDKRITRLVKMLTGSPIELQHSKFNAKPIKSRTKGEVKWHQDFPFYPHTNFDLITCGIHLDDEDEGSGALRMIPGSHKQGLKSHCKNGEFVYECTEMNSFKKSESELLTCKAGQVIFHHCLTLHNSDPKIQDGHRRIVIYQYRAQDAVQLSGVIWRCTGYQVSKKENNGYARLVDGTLIEIRGKNGKLIDMYGRFKPDT